MSAKKENFPRTLLLPVPIIQTNWAGLSYGVCQCILLKLTYSHVSFGLSQFSLNNVQI